MKKEVIFAIFVGALIGLFLGFGFFRANRAVKQKAQTVLESSPSGTTKPLIQSSGEKQIELKITHPLDNQVFFSPIATISGITSSNTPVAILAEENEYLLTSDNSGSFSIQIDLIKGINEVTVVSVSKLDERQEKKISLIFSGSEL